MACRMLVLLVALSLVLGASACRTDAPDESVPGGIPAEGAILTPIPAVATIGSSTGAPGMADFEFTTCEELIAEGEGGLGPEFAIAMYAGVLRGVIAGEPIDGTTVELTDEERAVWRAALDEIVKGDTYCGLVPIGE
jgi:hypothetical protein